MKKRWWIMLAVLLVAVVCLVPLPRAINVTQTGVLWCSGAPGDVQTTSVTVKGTYWDCLFLEDRFEGSIWVEACPETYGVQSVTRMGENQYGVWYATEDAQLKSFGGMLVRRDGSVLVMLHEDGAWSADTGRVLTAPAATREEAVALANELAKTLSPDWLGTWEFQ